MIILSFYFYVQICPIKTGDSTKHSCVGCVGIENCTHSGAKTSHEQLRGDAIQRLATLLNEDVLIRCRRIQKPCLEDAHDMHDMVAMATPPQLRICRISISVYLHRMPVGPATATDTFSPKMVNVYKNEGHVWNLMFLV